jgi:tryptophan synthase alpha chain
MSRIAQALAAPGRPTLVAYVTAGDPDRRRSPDVVRSIAQAGADIIEVGVPFSDPIADGPAIQRAQERALAAGATLDWTLETIAGLRAEITQPIVLFTYVNPVLRLGVETFVRRAAAAGVDGVLLLDLPIEEAGGMQAALVAHGIDPIFLVSPTTSDERLTLAGSLGRGFLYAISRLGVTGARDSVAQSAAPLVARVRAASSLPVALGFGISRPEHVREVGAYADAVVVGSALVQVIEEADRAGRDVSKAAADFVRWLKS